MRRPTGPLPHVVILPAMLICILILLCHPPHLTEAFQMTTEASHKTMKTLTTMTPETKPDTPTIIPDEDVEEEEDKPKKHSTEKTTNIEPAEETITTKATKDIEEATTEKPIKTINKKKQNKKNSPKNPKENNSNLMKTDRLNFTNDIFFTLVYGSQAAKMNFTESEKYCIQLGLDLKLTLPVTAQSHLVSIHDPFIMKTLMDWVLSKERRQFRIGGDVTKVLHRGRIYFVIHWYDGTRDDFRFFSEADETFANLTPGETYNLAVGYLDGRWIPVLPTRRAYFLCETRINDPEAMLRDSPHFHVAPVRRVRPVMKKD